jgi:hypothetical protein
LSKFKPGSVLYLPYDHTSEKRREYHQKIKAVYNKEEKVEEK